MSALRVSLCTVTYVRLKQRLMTRQQLRRMGRSRETIRAALLEDTAPGDAELARVLGEESDHPALRGVHRPPGPESAQG